MWVGLFFFSFFFFNPVGVQSSRLHQWLFLSKQFFFPVWPHQLLGMKEAKDPLKLRPIITGYRSGFIYTHSQQHFLLVSNHNNNEAARTLHLHVTLMDISDSAPPNHTSRCFHALSTSARQTLPLDLLWSNCQHWPIFFASDPAGNAPCAPARILCSSQQQSEVAQTRSSMWR